MKEYHPAKKRVAVSAGESVRIPPSEWIISDINEDGGWEPINKKVKWGPFFENTSRVLAYKTTPPGGTVGIKTFSGKGSFDGTGIAIGGSLSVELQPEKVFIHLPLIIKDKKENQKMSKKLEEAMAILSELSLDERGQLAAKILLSLEEPSEEDL